MERQSVLSHAQRVGAQAIQIDRRLRLCVRTEAYFPAAKGAFCATTTTCNPPVRGDKVDVGTRFAARL